MKGIERVLLNVTDLRRIPVNPDEVYFLEAVGDETLIRTQRKKRIRYVRSLGELFPLFEPYGFVRVHRNHAVNLVRIREIRRRGEGKDWEIKLLPPVNLVLPVSRNVLRTLFAAFR
jgi:DNA-binding LytR/AlgR family response regulator